MMNSSTSLALTIAVFVSFALVGEARADIMPPPPSDFQETCTIEQQNLQQKDCTVCSPHPDIPEECYRELSPDGYELFCKTGGGASAGADEIWCRGVERSMESANGAAGAGDTNGNDDGGDGACSAVVGGHDAGFWGMVLCSAAACLWMRRRGFAACR
jgi:hypothetical protein